MNKHQPSGEYLVEWDASGLKDGLYFLHFKVGDMIEVKKIIKSTE
jgi:hypothetical protein